MTTAINYVYITSAFSVESVMDGLTTDDTMASMIVQQNALQHFERNQLLKMIKSLNDETTCTIKDSKEVMMKALFDELNQLEVQHVAVKQKSSTGCTRKTSTGPSTKDTCYTVFKDYNLLDKEDSKLALADAMKACEMADDDIKAKRVVQSYMSYYRNDVKSGKITDGKSVVKTDDKADDKAPEQETEE